MKSQLTIARMRKHWTLSQASEQIGVDANTLGRWERGKMKPRGYNVQRLCEVYGITVEELGLEDDLPRAQSQLPPMPSQSEPINALQGFIKQDLTMRLWSLASPPHHTSQEIASAMSRILKDDDMHDHITRRKVLLNLLTLPMATLGVAIFTGEEHPTLSMAEHVLAQCSVSINACWELMRSSTEHNHLVSAFNGVSAYLPALQQIVKDSSQHRQEAAGLVTQCFLLKTMLAHHVENAVTAIHYAQQALLYGREARDIPLQLRAIECLAVAYTFDRQPQQALKVIEQSVPLLEQKRVPIPSHLHALINGMQACTQARNGQDGTAYLDQAEMLLLDTTKYAMSPAHAGYGKGSLLLDTGIVYSQQGEGTKAIEALSQFVDAQTLNLKMPAAEIRRIEVINTIALASLKKQKKDMEQTLHFWQAGIQGARKLQSKQRFNEALMSYEIMQAIWPGENKIKELRALTIHW